ncbi:hypothetical protein [Rhodococcus zopfii]|uniref:hypothetical protein n=1 Tax=Rhodococcus zopfii TaxID=43772 RepID=UPI0009351A0F|nr:hypothetical protein [Rhodococcus zopfii]
MTLAIPPRPATPIFDELDEHFATIPVDGTPAPDATIDSSQAPDVEVATVDDTNDSDDLDAHFATIPTDRAPASDTTPEDTTNVHRHRAAWFLWLILAVGVTIAAVIWLTAPAAVVVI